MIGRFSVSLAALLFLAVLCAGCAGEADKLYAMPLDRAPTEADWARAVPLLLEARGGRTSRPGESDVDSDTVHKATASCHHGTGAPAVQVDARAFYTLERLYLRFEWVDPTEDLGPFWRWEGEAWRPAADGGGQDGLGLLWGEAGEDFSCVRACHLSDWRMADPGSFADYVMAAPTGDRSVDLWIWRAGRGRFEGTAEDAHLGPKGREGDGPGDFDILNSVSARSGVPDKVYRPGDAPLVAPPPGPKAWAPATLVRSTDPGRTEVEAWGRRRPGAWQVVFSRALRGRDPDDVAFRAGGEFSFGLATLDGVAKDHNAVALPLRVLLVDPSALRGVKE